MKAIFNLSKGIKKKVSQPFCIAAFLLLSLEVYAQEDSSDPDWLGTLRIEEGYMYNNDSEWSTPGLNYTLYYKACDKFGFHSTTGFLLWNEADMNTFYTKLGVHVKLAEFSGMRLLAAGSAGPSAVIGNDYASIFAMTGAGLHLMPSKNKSVSATIMWNQNLVFHPSHFSYASASVGYVF